MFCSRLLFVAISLGAISVLASPHALQLPHHRAVAARVASVREARNNTRQHSPRCLSHSASLTDTLTPSHTPARLESAPTSTPAAPATPAVPATPATPTTPATPMTPATPTSPAATPTSTDDLPGVLQEGQGTFFQTGEGACGYNNAETDSICALSRDLFDEFTPDDNPNKNTLCGKKIQVSLAQNAAVNSRRSVNSVILTIVDRCVGCNKWDVDMTETAFARLADPDLGRINIAWEFL